MKLKDLLVQYRTTNKISQREFARRAELSNSLISIIEMGINPQTGKKMKPDPETYKKIASAMGISLHELFKQLDEDEIINIKPIINELDSNNARKIFVPDSQLFGKIIVRMSQLFPLDYEMVMEALERTEREMKTRGEL